MLGGDRVTRRPCLPESNANKVRLPFHAEDHCARGDLMSYEAGRGWCIHQGLIDVHLNIAVDSLL